MADHDTHDHTGVPGVGTGTTTTTVATDPIWDAAGDVVVGTGANTAARLAVGSADTYLGSNGSAASWSAVTDAKLSTSDITTNNATTAKHGFLKKLSNSATDYMDGTGNWSTPAGGGGSFAHAYIGYNTIGGSTAVAGNRLFLKKVTIAADCMISSIGIYIKQVTAGEVLGMAVSVLSDVTGTPTLLLAANGLYDPGLYISTSNGAAGAARWVQVPIGFWAVAGDYWLGVNVKDNGTAHQIYFDGSGSDQTYLPSSIRVSDAGWTTVTTTTNKYSIRASTLT